MASAKTSTSMLQKPVRDAARFMMSNKDSHAGLRQRGYDAAGHVAQLTMGYAVRSAQGVRCKLRDFHDALIDVWQELQ